MIGLLNCKREKSSLTASRFQFDAYLLSLIDHVSEKRNLRWFTVVRLQSLFALALICGKISHEKLFHFIFLIKSSSHKHKFCLFSLMHFDWLFAFFAKLFPVDQNAFVQIICSWRKRVRRDLTMYLNIFMKTRKLLPAFWKASFIVKMIGWDSNSGQIYCVMFETS